MSLKKKIKDDRRGIHTELLEVKDEIGQLREALHGLMKWTHRFHGNSWDAVLQLWLTRNNPKVTTFKLDENVRNQWSDEAKELWDDLDRADRVWKTMLSGGSKP